MYCFCSDKANESCFSMQTQQILKNNQHTHVHTIPHTHTNRGWREVRWGNSIFLSHIMDKIIGIQFPFNLVTVSK